MRDVWLDAVRARLRQVHDAQDLSAVTGRAALDEAGRLAAAGGDHDLEAGFALGWFHWYRSRALADEEARVALRAAVSALTPCFAAGVDELPEPLLPLLADAAVPLAVRLLGGAEHAADPVALSLAVGVWQRIADCTEHGRPDRAAHLFNLGLALVRRSELTGSPADLDTAVAVQREAVAALTPRYPHGPQILSGLAHALLRRGRATGSEADLAAAADHFGQAAAALPAGDPGRGLLLSDLANALQARFERTGSPADLDAAVEHFREAVAVTAQDHPERARVLANAGAALVRRFERTGAPRDADSGVELLRQALAADPVGESARVVLVNLGTALLSRARRTGSAADLDAAVGRLRQGVAASPPSHPDRAPTLTNLGNALLARHRRSGSEADLDAAVAAHEEAVAVTPAGSPARAGLLGNLASALTSRYRQHGTAADLDAAVAVAQEALAATPDDHPLLPSLLSNLASVLRARFIRTGAEADLDACVEHLQRAVAATPADHGLLAGRLSNLCNALHSRFQRTGARADLEAAITVGRQAVSAAADRADRAAFLANLANPLLSRHRRDGTEADLDAAIALGREAVATAPADHVDRPDFLATLGDALLRRHSLSGASADLDSAVDRLREAAETGPPGHSQRAVRLSNLGNALRTRFDRTGAAEDLEAAVAVGREAVAAAPDRHPDRATALFNLGNALRRRGERDRNPSAADHAAAAYAEAARLGSAPPSLRIRAGAAAADLLAASGRTDEAARTAEESVLLLPQVAPRHLERGDQQRAIGEFAGLSSDAASLVLAAEGGTADERAQRALSVLEAGRAVLLSRQLHTRSDLTDLAERHPGLARRFTELREVLDAPPGAGAGSPGGAALPPGDLPARHLRDAAAELAGVLAEIRALDGFASFALPPSTGDLLAQAAEGPVVVFNVSRRRSDALLLRHDGITALHLPGLTVEGLVTQLVAFRRAQALAVSGATRRERTLAQIRLLTVLEWLWDTAAGPVLDALGHGGPLTGAGTGDGADDGDGDHGGHGDGDHGDGDGGRGDDAENLPRIWWASGGLLGLLPLHAAGHHNDPAGRTPPRTVLDRAVSSYTPTVQALRHARERDRASAGAGRSLLVAMPTTPGLPGGGRLDAVEQEADELRALLPDPLLLREPDPGAEADADSLPTKANVLRLLPESTIAHFACHGASDPVDPSRSRLLLHDHDTDPLTVVGLAPLVLDRARLAYLSACHTAATDTVELLDEAIHLSSAFQLAGFPHVVGTLWQISDGVALTVARRFYDGLRHDGPGTDTAALDPRRAARALHRAVRDARDGRDLAAGRNRRRSPLLWAAHVHAGA
ncbi:CHAT domain-containing protein [Streptomyces sp. NPDC093094]|uniref:CHAT domain-containing protein n=1 Tax=Streptomyces sp. NPDC093094 TaxID=3366026 RepID=UPI0037FE2F55